MNNSSLGLFHTETGGQFGFYYMLTRATASELPVNSVLSPFLSVQLPDGIGMTFDKEMVGWYFPGAGTPAPGRDGDLTIAARIPASGTSAGAVTCQFDVHVTVVDVNEFVDGYEHEAQLGDAISFGQFAGQASVTFPVDGSGCFFNYLGVNPQTGEAEMRYHIEFADSAGQRYVLEGVKYMRKDPGFPAIADLLGDYTTLYKHVFQQRPDGTTSGKLRGYPPPMPLLVN